MLALMVIASVSTGWAGPRSEPVDLLAERYLRAFDVPAMLGAPDRSASARAAALLGELDPDDPRARALATALSVELDAARVGSGLLWRVDPRGALLGGTRAADYDGGDPMGGLVGLRAGVDARLMFGPAELTLSPELRLDAAPGDATVALSDAWLGLRGRFGLEGDLGAGFGVRDRWLGPGRHGGLMLTDNARPAPAGSAWIGGRLWRLGRLRFESGAGWLDGERSDVQRPGWLFMDLRWAPVTGVELGLSRVGIFGGVGRPTPDLGQIILPTDPHVYDDPNQAQPDQDELASLDLRVRLPVARWAGRPAWSESAQGVDGVEFWWEYGAEDLIVRETAGLNVPALAGVANLYGGEVTAGPLALTVEHARVFDDTFRWYTGHRVYHQGFTRDGRVMAQAAGGDSISNWGALTWMGARRGAELSLERVERIGVVEANDRTVVALLHEERAHRVGGRAFLFQGDRWWTLEGELGRVTDADFVPGADGWEWRIALRR